MYPTKPTILIVHGGYFLPEVWTPFMSTLKTVGFDALCPRLPTCGDTRPPTATLTDDVKAVRDVATDLVQAGKQVIVLAHSYGGIPASEAIIPALYSPNSASPGVIHLIYLTCWLIPKSQSVQAVLGKYSFLSHVDVGINEDGTAVAKNAADAFYNDVLPRSRAEELARDNVTHNIMVVGESVEGVPWMDVESTYVICEKDEALLMHLQRSMVKDAQEAGGKVRVETLASGHCPFLSQPDEVVKIVEKVAAKARAGTTLESGTKSATATIMGLPVR